MRLEKLKESAKKIKMTDEMKERIIRRATEAAPAKKPRGVRPALIAAAIAVLTCFGAALAAGRAGLFKDVKDWKGTVVGSVYENASEEIEVSVSAENGLAVTAAMVEPDMAPYKEFDSLGIDSYKIVDMTGAAMAGGSAGPAEISGGKAVIALPADGLGDGDYMLVIDAFAGYSKADQPLRVTGGWECEFALSGR